MNRAQRSAHARTWLLLALVLLAIVVAAVTIRQHISNVSVAAQEWAPR